MNLKLHRFQLHGFRLRKAARRLFGWRSLRPGQLAAMRAILRGHDVFAILPTGAGKSAIYQIPGTLLPGPTIVVSPLLALQYDQLTSLNDREHTRLRAVRISSAETPKQQQESLRAMREKRAEFLFITPEQLANPERVAEVKALRPSLVAIDEAHCVSSWGHDFRPDYLALGSVIRELGRPAVVALTATASPPVRDDIIERLGLRKPRLVQTGLDRPNLFLECGHCPTEEHRWRRLKAFLDTAELPGIVYVPTRRAAEELAERLKQAGHEAEYYHGGLAAGARTERHEAFTDDKVPIMVATSAFGMGIDKPNIRWVAHVALPDSPDSYLQEIGRAGRDGAPARALLLHRAEDVALQRFFTGGTPDEKELRDLAALVGPETVTKKTLTEQSGLSPRKLGQLLALLEQVNAVHGAGHGKYVRPPYAPRPAEAAQLALAEVERHQTLQKSRTDMMRAFAESTQCRTRALLAYFGDNLGRACGHCDNCLEGTVEPAPAVADYPFPLNSTVRHGEWGEGMVLGYEEDRMTVLFDDVGYKTLSVPIVRRQGLLQPVTR